MHRAYAGWVVEFIALPQYFLRIYVLGTGVMAGNKTDNFLVFWDLIQAKVIITESRLQQSIMNIIRGEKKDVLEVYHTIA